MSWSLQSGTRSPQSDQAVVSPAEGAQAMMSDGLMGGSGWGMLWNTEPFTAFHGMGVAFKIQVRCPALPSSSPIHACPDGACLPGGGHRLTPLQFPNCVACAIAPRRWRNLKVPV